MELHTCPADQSEHAIVSYLPDGKDMVIKELDSLAELPDAIREAQDKLAGTDSNIVEDEIRLELYAHSAPVRHPSCIRPCHGGLGA